MGRSEVAELRQIASGLRFPEGPIAMADGSVVLVEIQSGHLSRVSPDGTITRIAETGGGPNGAAVGPDGKVYVCNNGGFAWGELDGMAIPGAQPEDYIGGRIQRVDLETGKVEDVYTECDGFPLRGPNDIVFDDLGGFYFTDHGIREHRTSDRTGVFYAQPDGSAIREVLFPLDAPNGVGLSPDGSRIYVAETYTACVWWWELAGPGDAKSGQQLLPHGGLLLNRLPGFQFLDSLAVDGDGNVCVATPDSGMGVPASLP